MKTIIISLTLLQLIIFSNGCIGAQDQPKVNEPTIVVLDKNMSPVADAIITTYANHNRTEELKTNKDGRSKVLLNINAVIFIEVRKGGYKTLNAPIPKEWPLQVILQKL